MKRRGTFLALAGLAMTSCGTQAQSQPSAPAPDPRAVRDQQAFARSAKELRDLHNSFKSDLDAIAHLIPTPQQQPTSSTKIDPQFSETAKRTIAQTIDAFVHHLNQFHLVAYRAGAELVLTNAQPEVHAELKSVVRLLDTVQVAVSAVCQNLKVAYRAAGYRYTSASDLNQTRGAAEDAYKYLAEAYAAINQPTIARGLDLASL